MPRHIDAIFENGAFRPVGSGNLEFSDGEFVRLIVDVNYANGSENLVDVLSLATRVYAGLSIDEVNDIERIAKDRTRFFSSEDR